MGMVIEDPKAALQVITCLYNSPSLLDDSGKYFFKKQDFPNEFHRVLLRTIQRLHDNGVNVITLQTFEDKISNYPEEYAIYKAHNGAQWIVNNKDIAQLSGFDYYYSRLKKFTLLREYQNIGCDIRKVYDPNEIFDAKKIQRQEEFLDELTLDNLAKIFEKDIEEVRRVYVNNSVDEAELIGSNLSETINDFLREPEVGVPMYGWGVNTITRGMRLGKLYLRSAPTGIGKTRTMVADACYCACTEMWDSKEQKWVNIGSGNPVLYIATEQELDEIQTMALAFLAEVDEEHILTGSYQFGEKDRVDYAIKILQKAQFWVECIPDFSLQDIENCIKRNLTDPNRNVQWIFFDYVHTSMKMMEEISRRAGGIKMREDQFLSQMSIKLKELCVKYGVFILTSTQLNGDYQTSKTPDQNLLRGAKAIADKADFGSILLEVTQEDLENIQGYLEENGWPTPNVKMSIYKNRRGKFNKGYLWMVADRATCRFNGWFYTDYKYKPYTIGNLNIDFRG